MKVINKVLYSKYPKFVIIALIIFAGVYVYQFPVTINQVYAEVKSKNTNGKIGVTVSGRVLAFDIASNHSANKTAALLAKTLIEKDKLTKYIPDFMYYSFLDGDYIQFERTYKKLKLDQNSERQKYFKVKLKVLEAAYLWNNNKKRNSKFNDGEGENSIRIFYDVVNFWRTVSENPKRQNEIAKQQLKTWAEEYGVSSLVTRLSSLVTLLAISDDDEITRRKKQQFTRNFIETTTFLDPMLISLMVKSSFDVSKADGNKTLSLLRRSYEGVIAANKWQSLYKKFNKSSYKQKASMMLMFIGTSQLLGSPEQTLFFSRVSQYLNSDSDSDGDFANYWIAKSLTSINDDVSFEYRFAQAHRVINKIGRNSEMFLQATILKSNIYNIEKKWRLANKVIQKAKKLFSKLPHLYFEEGILYSQQKKYALAVDSYSKGISLFGAKYPEDSYYYFRRAIAFEKINKWSKAELDLKKALEINPNDSHVLNYLAYTWVIKEKNLKEAFDMLYRANKLLPGRAFVIDSLGWALYHQKRYNEATEVLEQAIVITPLDPEINDHLGDVYWQLGRRTEAKVQWRRSLQFNNGNVNIDGLRSKLKNGL